MRAEKCRCHLRNFIVVTYIIVIIIVSITITITIIFFFSLLLLLLLRSPARIRRDWRWGESGVEGGGSDCRLLAILLPICFVQFCFKIHMKNKAKQNKTKKQKTNKQQTNKLSPHSVFTDIATFNNAQTKSTRSPKH